MRHLTSADYVRMPWANGRGTTIEMLRIDGPEGLVLRLSMASVVEDGPFSVFPGIERSLTVLSGPGFRLEGDVCVECRPLVPVAFPGEACVSAVGTGGLASEDFNVMSSARLSRPTVTVLRGPDVIPRGGTNIVLALGPIKLDGCDAGLHDLVCTEGRVAIAGPGPAIVVRFGETVVPSGG